MQIVDEFVPLDGFMLVLIIAPLMVALSVDPVGLAGIDAGSLVPTLADFLCDPGDRIPAACVVRPRIVDSGCAVRAGIACSRYTERCK